MRRCILIIVSIVCGALSASVSAHEVRPAYLELRQTSEGTYDVLWKVPARGDMRLGIYVAFPAGTVQLTEPRAMLDDGAHFERWSVRVSGGGGDGLTGKEIRINGLHATRIDVLARIEHLSGAVQMARVLPDNPAFIVEAAPSAWNVASTYLILGIEHIVLGIDHLQFVLALVLLVKGWRRLVGTITAFTVAHSITLALATLGMVNVPGPPVEACIALSIVFVAAEIIRTQQNENDSIRKRSLAERAPWLVALTFGLLHGLGFAGALSDVGLPMHAFPLALLFFNVGVEIGQLAFVIAVLGLISIAGHVPMPAPSWSWRVAPYCIGAVAMFWVIQRFAAF
jgi:hypothetical protein